MGIGCLTSLVECLQCIHNVQAWCRPNASGLQIGFLRTCFACCLLSCSSSGRRQDHGCACIESSRSFRSTRKLTLQFAAADRMRVPTVTKKEIIPRNVVERMFRVVTCAKAQARLPVCSVERDRYVLLRLKSMYSDEPDTLLAPDLMITSGTYSTKTLEMQHTAKSSAAIYNQTACKPGHEQAKARGNISP